MWKLFTAVFCSVFMAELGDKTQLAAFCFASDSRNSALTVFLASSAALILATAIGVFAGNLLSRYINPALIHKLGGLLFIIIGLLLLLKKNV
ncbi:MAG: TMEM165/GDT1 family protein [Candidatus Wallbacteria bacterium]|nr:TMEM165/GDT1 family protein [Candidatus Wallbacteria bacterium]